MNEQLIAKLAYATLLRTGAPTGNREWQKIFVELIVKECAAVINKEGESQFSEGIITNLGGLNQARELIKDHFGVKE
jgi:hypothetical protein